MERKEEEWEIIIDLSGKIKFSDSLYVSVGTLLLSTLIAIIHVLWFLCSNNWQFEPYIFSIILDFITAIRGESTNKQIKEE